MMLVLLRHTCIPCRRLRTCGRCRRLRRRPRPRLQRRRAVRQRCETTRQRQPRALAVAPQGPSGPSSRWIRAASLRRIRCGDRPRDEPPAEQRGHGRCSSTPTLPRRRRSSVMRAVCQPMPRWYPHREGTAPSGSCLWNTRSGNAVSGNAVIAHRRGSHIRGRHSMHPRTCSSNMLCIMLKGARHDGEGCYRAEAGDHGCGPPVGIQIVVTRCSRYDACSSKPTHRLPIKIYLDANTENPTCGEGCRELTRTASVTAEAASVSSKFCGRL